MDERKLRLANALENEMNELPEESIFGDKNDKILTMDAIDYLRTGKLPNLSENNELLLACIEDIETLYSDYGIN